MENNIDTYIEFISILKELGLEEELEELDYQIRDLFKEEENE